MSTGNPSPEEIKAKPSHYIGYPGFANWIASDNDFLVLRRFDGLAARVLLRKQWQLCKVEKQLADLDLKLSRGDDDSIDNGSFESDDPARTVCIGDADKQLGEYCIVLCLIFREDNGTDSTIDEFLNSYISIREKPDASSQAKRHLRRWMAHWEHGAIKAGESSYVNRDDDLFALFETPRAPMHQLLDKFSVFYKKPDANAELGNLSPSDRHASHPKAKIYRHNHRMKLFATLAICIGGFLMLVAPMWILIYIQSRQRQLAVITVFVFTFLALVQSVTLAKSFECLAATAAYASLEPSFNERVADGKYSYAAVLIVFLQTTPTNFFSNG